MSFKHQNIIDYPFTTYRSDFMDIYLQYRARFVLSSGYSGCTDVVTLFGTPFCAVNSELNVRLTYENGISIPRRYLLEGRLVGLREFVEMANRYWETKTYYHTPNFLVDNHLVQVDNTKEEILALAEEMFERLEGKFIQTPLDKELQEKSLSLLTQIKDENINRRYMPLGRDFLRENASWYLA